MTHTALIYQRPHPPVRPRPLRLGLPEDRVLRALGRYHVATCQQLVRACGYASGSLTYIQSVMKRLTEAGYCRRPYYPRTRPQGSSPALYTLGGKGRAYLRSLGLDVPPRYRPSEEQHAPYFYDHNRAVVDYLIALDLLCRRRPDLVVMQALLTERDLKRRPLAVQDAEGHPQHIVPDLFLDLRIRRVYQTYLLVEVDRGTEERAAWTAKVARLLAYAQGPFQAAYQTSALTIMVATPHEKRCRHLLDWTTAELRRLQREPEADLFRVTSLSPLQAAPEDLFLGPTSYRPGDPTPRPILTLEEGST